MARRHFRFLLPCFLALCACGDDGPHGPDEDLTQVTILPDSATLFIGDTLHLSVSISDRAGRPILNRPTTWSSSDTTVLVVKSDGTAVGRRPGLASATARVGGSEISAKIIVRSPPVCGDAGTQQSGRTSQNTTWRTQDGPHVIPDSIVILHEVTVEAGALICGLPNARILIRGNGKLTAVGTSARPIRFLPIDPVRGWGGIATGALLGEDGGGQFLLDHGVVEFANAGVTSGYASIIVTDNSRFRRTNLGSSYNFSSFTIRNSVVDTGIVSMVAGTFENTTINLGELHLQWAQPGSSITINGGRIENSLRTALTIGSTVSGRVPVLNIVKPLDIVGSRGRLVDMPLSTFLQMWPTREAQDALLNNVSHAIRVWGSTSGHLFIRPPFEWEIIHPFLPAVQIELLTLQPGATLRLFTMLVVPGGLRAIGTSGQPITLTSTRCAGTNAGCTLRLSGSGTSRITHANLSNVSVDVFESHRVEMDSIASTSWIRLASTGSSIRTAELRNYAPNPASESLGAALIINGAGVVADRIKVNGVAGRASFTNLPIAAITIDADSVRVTNCDVADNQNDGLVVLSGTGTRISACNIERNGLLGINNMGATIADARNNWWGDAGGPNAPAGDGVSTNVDFSGWLTQRIPR